jgi:hypothetical protein
MTPTKEQDRPSLSLVSQNGRHVKGKPRSTRPVTEEEGTVELIENVQELHDRMKSRRAACRVRSSPPTLPTPTTRRL